MKPDPAIDAIRKVRSEISREFDHDPARLMDHYVQMQAKHTESRVIYGPEDPRGHDPRSSDK